MTSLGYARVSTIGQSLDQQHDALTGAGVERIFDDKMSGARDDRPGLAALLDYAREGDTVTVIALDRLGRSVMHVLRTMEDLRERGIALKSLREGVDFSTPVGQMVAGIFMHLAEYERTLINERAAAAREAMRMRGKPIGRKRKLDPDQVALVCLKRQRGMTVPEIVAETGASRATVYRALQSVGEIHFDTIGVGL
jgi:DNA invertase Pin-like site-specific DNA recombinase